MSVSLITDADIINLVRPAGLAGGGTDTGTGMGINLHAVISDANPSFQPVSFPSGFLTGAVCPNYNATGPYFIEGDVNWDGIITEIPDAAQIHRMVITAQASASGSALLDASRIQGAIGDLTGGSSIGVGAKLIAPDAPAPPVSTFIAETDVNSDTDVTLINATSSVSAPGTILRAEWDFTDTGIYPLGYITRAQLVSQFTVQRVSTISTTSSIAQWTLSYNHCGLAIPVILFDWDADIDFTVVINNWLMEVTWEFPLDWTLITPTDPIEAGDEVEAESPLVDGIDWEQVTSVTLTSPDGDSVVLVFTAIDVTHFIFTVPTLIGDPPIVHVVITSTQFSGEVDLGPLVTIFFLNATGIYTLVPGKTNDTIYDNDDPGATVDVKIPNPTWKTGFIGG